jgi:hypothetical protein
LCTALIKHVTQNYTGINQTGSQLPLNYNQILYTALITHVTLGSDRAIAPYVTQNYTRINKRRSKLP